MLYRLYFCFDVVFFFFQMGVLSLFLDFSVY